MLSDHRQTLLRIFQSALAAVNGRVCVRGFLKQHSIVAPVYLLSIGKAACGMAQGAHDILSADLVEALVITKQGYAESLPWPVREAGHPLPDADSLAAGQELLDFTARIPRHANVLVLLSGGASALVEVLPPGVTLNTLRAVNDWLLASGLDIAAMNRLRKQLSCLKGGRLAQRLFPRPVLCLAISDVPGDDPCVIGSGPLVADPMLSLSGHLSALPEFVRDALRHHLPALPVNDDCFRSVRLEIIATLDTAKRAAFDAAQQLGYHAALQQEFITGDSIAAGSRLATQLLASPRGEIQIWGGETSLVLPPHPGRGGRNQSLALAAAQVLAGHKDVWFLSAGTDGSDGPGLDAGALVDGGTIARGAQEGYKAASALAAADAGSFLEASGDLIQTGPTGTNVMDLMIGLRA